MSETTILLPSGDAAERLVAGVPAAARTARRVSGRGANSSLITLATPHPHRPSQHLLSEIERIAPRSSVRWVGFAALENDEAIDGLELLRTGSAPARLVDQIIAEPAYADPSEARRQLAQASRIVLRSTAKRADGYVAQFINRPISRAISSGLLKTRWARPNHATFVTWLIGLVMAACLVLGGESGLIAGALLFQLASIIDGVDGEIARATRRQSRLGAALDTMGDVATNLGFLTALGFNLWQADETLSAEIIAAGAVLLAIGLALLGISAKRQDGAVTFEAMKHKAHAGNSRVMQVLARLASRDFYAFGFAVLISLGLTQFAVSLFTAVTAVWLPAVILHLIRNRG